MKKNMVIFLLALFFIVSQVYSQDILESPDAEAVELPVADQTSNTPVEGTHGEASRALSITDKGVEGYIHGEHNRSARFVWDISATGDLELNDFVLFNAGFSFGRAGEAGSVSLFTAASVYPFSMKYLTPLSFSLKWLYTGLIKYEEHINSLIPMISYGTDTLGISIGFNLRFSNYFKEPAQFEPIFTYLLYWNFLNKETFRVGVKWGTYGDFYARNMGAMSLRLDMDMRINENWTIITEIEYLQSGQDGFAANFYGLSWKGGVRFTW